VYRSHPYDTPSILQIGTASVDWAVKTALHFQKDIDALDVNMGCPKHFSVHAGMGVALLQDKQRAKEILTKLVEVMDKPVTCKIRLLESMADTIDLVKTLEQTGVKAIGVHGRYIPDRPKVKAHMELLPQVQSAVSIPIIANGDIFEYDDIEKIKKISGFS